MSFSFTDQQVFLDSFSLGHVVSPPERVFAQADFVTLLTQNVDLFDDEEQYQAFLRVLVRLGEHSFQLVENLGATRSEPRAPYTASFSVESTYAQFQAVVEAFDPPFGFFINHFYLFGQQPTWGIYLCEWPTMTLIGSLPALQPEFAHVFAIQGNGYAVLREFIGREFQAAPALQELFEQNYQLLSIF
jgi:hypothetical protein